MRTIYDYSMLYTDEHFKCSRYIKDVKYGLRYKEYKQGSIVTGDSIDANLIIFVLKGSIMYDCSTKLDDTIGAGYMMFVPYKMLCDLKFVEDSVIIELSFEHWDFKCNVTPFEKLRTMCNYIENPTHVLPITAPLQSYLDLLKIYLRSGVSCGAMHKLKVNEFFMLIRHFYSKEQVAGFLGPLLGGSHEFRMMCLRMREKSHNISELVSGSGMSKSKFYEEFRKEFGDINPKKWFDAYLEYRVLREAAKPGATVKELAYTFGFDAESSFSQYCHRHFGVTASELIKKRRKHTDDL